MVSRWPNVRVSDLVTQNTISVAIEPDKTYKLLGVRLAGQGPFLREEKAGNEIQATRLNPVQAGDFIYSRLFAWRGAFGLVPNELDGCYVSNEFPTFRIDAERIFPRFLNLHFTRPLIWEEVEKYCIGTTKASRNRFKEEFFLGLEIPLPPLAEQQHIVARIEELARRVEEARRLRREAVEEAEALVAATLSALVSEFHVKFRTRLLKELLVEAGYGTSVKCHVERERDAMPVLRIPNVASERVSFDDLKYGILSESERAKASLHDGDILVVRTNGSADLVGRCAVVPQLPEATAFASYLIRLRCDRKYIEPQFLQLILRQQRTAGLLFDFARTTAGQYNVSLGRLQNTNVPLPPHSEQRHIIAYLDDLQAKVDELRRLQAETQKELDALMPSVLAKAFAGEL